MQVFFIHVPKTAGSSIHRIMKLNSIKNHSGGHKKLSDIGKPSETNAFIFTFTRNPWDRLVSTFFYLKNGGRLADDAKDAEVYLSKFNTFKDFVYSLKSDITCLKQQHLMPQIEYLRPVERINFLGRYENIQNDFLELAEILRLKHRIFEKLNQTEHKPFREYYNDEMVKIVGDVYEEDVKTFKYSFNS